MTPIPLKNIRLQFARWDDLTDEDQAQFFTFMGNDADRGRKLYELYFYWYNIPHEIAHVLRKVYLPSNGDVWERIWEEETAANQLAVSYWRAKGQNARLMQLENDIRQALRNIPGTAPENEDRTAFLNRRHQDLTDPTTYAQHQFNMVRYALARPLDLSLALKTLVSPQATNGATIPLAREFPLDEDLPYRTVDDMRRTLYAYGLRLPEIQIICMYSPALQFVLWDG
jgi:hypothetical protein